MSARATRSRLGRNVLVLTGAVLIVAYSLGPFVWMLIASITPEITMDNRIWQSGRGVEYFPSEPTWRNYSLLFESVPFALYFRNSAIVATGTMALSLLVASLGAYGFTRFRFRGRAPLLTAMLVAYMIPSVVLLVPLMVMFRSYGLINTFPGLILAETTIAAPFVLLLLINYLSALPRELEEAAMVDGCSRLGTLVRIVLPLSLPGLVAGALFAFIISWNNFLFAFLFTSTDDVKTLPVLMRLFALGEPAVWGISAAGAVLSTLPVALLFLAFQRLFIGGLAAGAIKG
jgi:ABC-type glycerol-3-phosphate transport system permease component